jgi:tRNA 2-thiocytidine biosynthesis protein TtcA
MLAAADRLLLGISGGEDSLMLMHILVHLQRRAPFSFTIVPAVIDLEFTSLDRPALQQYAQRQNWRLNWVKIPGEEILAAKNAQQKPCPLCSRLRRGQLHKLAGALDCNKIVLGHHLDDLCSSFLLALFRGGGLKTMGPNVAADGGSKRLIRPLCLLTKEEIHQAAKSFGFPPIRSCPYEEELRQSGDRFYLENLLEKLELKFKNVRHAMLHSLADIRAAHLLDQRFLFRDDPDEGKL